MPAPAEAAYLAAADGTNTDDSEAIIGEGGQSIACGGDFRRTCAVGLLLLSLGAVAVARSALPERGGVRRTLRRGNVTSDVGLSGWEIGQELFDPRTQIVTDQRLDGGYKGDGPAPGIGAMANAPVEDIHDGNFCDDDEEAWGKLCYKKCSLLTDGRYPKRTSAWSCCPDSPDGKCGLFDQKVKLSICRGFDVSGDRAGNGCPHPPGACLDNEELHLGRCYKTCTSLTNGEYPTRIAAATCCKSTEKLACLDIMNLKTRSRFNVGGGKGDGDERTPRRPHWPLRAVTEQA